MSKCLIDELVEVSPKTTLPTNIEGNEFPSLPNSMSSTVVLLEDNLHQEEHSSKQSIPKLTSMSTRSEDNCGKPLDFECRSDNIDHGVDMELDSPR